MSSKLSTYLASQSRNKIVIYKEYLPEMKTINMGKVVSEQIKNILSNKKLVLKAISAIDSILVNAITEHEHYGKYIAIENIGILLESELKIDFIQFLDKYSKSNVLFLKWEGETNNNFLYFLNKMQGMKFNIKNLSHITI